MAKLSTNGFDAQTILVASDSRGLVSDVIAKLKTWSELKHATTHGGVPRIENVGGGGGLVAAHAMKLGNSTDGDIVKTWAEWFLLQEAAAVVGISNLANVNIMASSKATSGSLFLESA